ncbi:MAG: hypothetical protein WCK54_18300 [Desulfuromonadales bacterium]
MKPEFGKSYLWQEKRIFTFMEKDGSSYYFRCADFADVNDPSGICKLSGRELKQLSPITRKAA